MGTQPGTAQLAKLPGAPEGAAAHQAGLGSAQAQVRGSAAEPGQEMDPRGSIPRMWGTEG